MQQPNYYTRPAARPHESGAIAGRRGAAEGSLMKIPDYAALHPGYGYGRQEPPALIEESGPVARMKGAPRP